MSYVPKYVLKRMIAQDGLKAVEGGVDIAMHNIIATIPADQIPGDPLDLIKIKLNGSELSKEEKSQILVKFEDKSFKLGQIRDAGTIPVNTMITFHFPTTTVKAGEEVTVDIDIPEVNVSMSFTRTVQ